MIDNDIAERVLDYIDDGESTASELAEVLACAIVNIVEEAYPTERKWIIEKVEEILEEM